MKEIIELTKALIQFRSVHSEPQRIVRCAEFIEDYLSQHGIHFRRLIHNHIPSLLVMPEKRHVPVILMSHIDVVDAPVELFTPCEKMGNLYGRGSIDDKYAVALSLVLLKNYRRMIRKQGLSRKTPPFGIVITGDEEIGGKNGAKQALKEVKTDFCIALDGGSPGEIIVKEKGIVTLKMTSKGRAAHGARPWLGENAIEKLIADYSKLKMFFDPQVRDDPQHWHRTINFSMIHAGKVQNQVPDVAEARFDIRYTESDDIEELLSRMRHAIESDIVVEAIEPMFISQESPYLDLLLDMAPDATIGMEHGASDARHLRDIGIPGIVWGADGDLSQHTLNEHVRIDSIHALYNRLLQFMKKIDETALDA